MICIKSSVQNDLATLQILVADIVELIQLQRYRCPLRNIYERHL